MLKYIVLLLTTALLLSACATTQQGSKTNKHITQEQPLGGNTEAQLRNSYAAATSKRDALEIRINNLSRESNNAKRSVARRAQKELTKVQAEYDAVTRLIASFPPSVSNLNGEGQIKIQEKEMLQQQMDQKYQEKRANHDFDQEIIDDIDDPELRTIYDNVQKHGTAHGSKEEAEVPSTLFYTVQIASGAKGRAKYFKGLDADEVSINSNSSAYYVGKFSSESEAIQERNRIRSSTQYKDAFVIAIHDGAKISVNQAKSLK